MEVEQIEPEVYVKIFLDGIDHPAEGAPKGTACRKVSISELKPSEHFWGDPRAMVNDVFRASPTRRIAAIGDRIFGLDNSNCLVWQHDTAPLTDRPFVDSKGIVYVIALDITHHAYDLETGRRLWYHTGVGRRVFSQLEVYEDDMYFVVEDMSGYEDHSDRGLRTINDRLLLFQGDCLLWETEIPGNSRIRFRNGRVSIFYRQTSRIVEKPLRVPARFPEDPIPIMAWESESERRDLGRCNSGRYR